MPTSHDIRLIEIEPGRWVVDKSRIPPARSNLPMPYLIGDEIEPIEQVDGRYYTSKASFRAVGRSFGLTEVGNETIKPKRRSSENPAVKQARRIAIQKAFARL